MTDQQDPTIEVTFASPISETLQQLIGSVKREVLRQFIEQLMTALQGEGYLLHELVACLADFAEQRGEEEQAEILDQAVQSLFNIHRRSRTENPSVSGEEANED
jgi:hypothetical protein